MKASNKKFTLDRTMTYQIKVPGHFDEGMIDLGGVMMVTVDTEGDGSPVTTLTGAFDQAALQGLLRRLYSMGLPLISVDCIDVSA